jgi:large subunit ribosomal protein L18
MRQAQLAKKRRQKSLRYRIAGSPSRPRLSVFRSNKAIYGSLVDDQAGKTLLSATERELKSKTTTKTERAFEVGKLLATKASKKNIKQVIFDRAGYLYHGRVKALAEGAREGGLEF